jgi:hypothetical protein
MDYVPYVKRYITREELFPISPKLSYTTYFGGFYVRDT